MSGADGGEFGELCCGTIVRLKPRRSPQLGDERTKRAVGMIRRALITQVRVRFAGDALGERGPESGLADAGLARDQHDLRFALPGYALPHQHGIKLVLAVDDTV